MKSILIYFRRDDSLGRGRMSPSGRGECLPRAGEDVSLGRGRASNPSGGWHVATGSILLSVLLLSSCSTTKNLPEGAVLYTGIKKIEVKNEDKTKPGEAALEEVEAALAYPPQQRLAGKLLDPGALPLRPVGLQRFREQEREGRQVDLQQAGVETGADHHREPGCPRQGSPEPIERVRLFQRRDFFRGHTRSKNPRKAKLEYSVTMNDPYTLDSIQYVHIRHRADSLIDATIGDRILHKGENFNVVQLQAERERISSLLRNNGYYYFRPDFITYQADTLLNPGKVALRVAPKESLPPSALRPWKLGDISVWLNGYQNETPTDSIRYKDLTIHYEGKLRVRPSVIYNRLYFKPGELYNQRAQERTQTALSRLGIFRYAELQYSPRDTMRRQDTLDLRINTVYDLPLDGELELNVTAKSNDQVGPGAISVVTKRNVFGGARPSRETPRLLRMADRKQAGW